MNYLYNDVIFVCGLGINVLDIKWAKNAAHLQDFLNNIF